MQWFHKLVSFFSPKHDLEEIKKKLYSPNQAERISDPELEAYALDIQKRIHIVVKQLRTIYRKHGINFSGFKFFDGACECLMKGIHSDSEQAYNNLIKLESVVNLERKRHLTLIKMAMTIDGKLVIEQINNDPVDKQIFIDIFGDTTGAVNAPGVYQHIWYEMHKLSEYVLLHHSRIYN